MRKKLILVTSPPACGKTFISKKLAEQLRHVVYLDKDTLIVLSKQIFKVAGEEYNRSSDFFEEHIRDYEYDAIIDLGLEAILYEDMVLINAPFTREIRDKKFMDSMKEKLAEINAELCVVWVVTDPEVCHQRMIARGSDRDTWKLENWDEYIKGVNFEIPELLKDPSQENSLLIFNNSSDEEFHESMERIVSQLQENE